MHYKQMVVQGYQRISKDGDSKSQRVSKGGKDSSTALRPPFDNIFILCKSSPPFIHPFSSLPSLKIHPQKWWFSPSCWTYTPFISGNLLVRLLKHSQKKEANFKLPNTVAICACKLCCIFFVLNIIV